MYKKNGLIATYLRVKESGSVSDFPNVMADVQHKILLEAFKGFPSQYDKYCMIGDLADFKPHNRKWLSETQDLDNVSGGAPYKNSKLSDRGYAIQAGTYGKTFQLLREVVLNDDLNAFKKVPASQGRSAKRTLVKQICSILESNGNAYDANPLFGSRAGTDSQGTSFTDLNDAQTALTADSAGIAAIQAGLLAIATAHDPDIGEIMGLQAKYLVVSPARAEAAKWIVHATTILRGSTDAPGNNPLADPALAGQIEVIVEPFLTRFPNRWYLFADPMQVPTIEVGFLNGQKEPELFMKDSGSVRASGGRDDFGYEYDDISYKVRWDWGIQTAFYQGAYKGGA